MKAEVDEHNHLLLCWLEKGMLHVPVDHIWRFFLPHGGVMEPVYMSLQCPLIFLPVLQKQDGSIDLTACKRIHNCEVASPCNNPQICKVLTLSNRAAK
jgi:hypothetical protein